MIKPDYTNNIINISNSLLKHYNCPIKYKTLPFLDNLLSNNYNHVILILLDGLGVNVINAHLNDDHSLKRNLKKTLTSVFPPTTVAATTAVLSAVPPFASGFLGWCQYNKYEQATEVVFLNQDYYNNANKLKTSLRYDFLSYLNILDKIKLKNKKLNVELLMPFFDKKYGYDSFAEQLNQLLMITKGEPSFSYCYWVEPDLKLHKYGIKSDEVKEEVLKLNNLYERFLNEIDDDVLVIVTADHGFCDVNEVDLFSYSDLVATFRQKPSIEARALTFFIQENKKAEFELLFNKYFKTDFILLTKTELYESELLGYGKKHYLLDSFIGDYMAISVSDKIFKLVDDSYVKAHHAGLTKEELEVPLIVNK